MSTPTAPATIERPSGSRAMPLPWRSALLLAAWFGLVGGYLDLATVFLRRDLFHAGLYYEQGRHFRWVVPLVNLALLLVAGSLVAAVDRLRPGTISLRAAAWLLVTLALWGPLLRAPLYGVATLVVAAGLGRWLSRRVASRPSRALKVAGYGSLVLTIALTATAAVSLRRESSARSAGLAGLPQPPPGAKNVLLIVMDTVRAESLGLYGYGRDTTPHLARWARRGVLFESAWSAAPWTFPSHCTLMTGQWPSIVGAHWLPTLDAPTPTLAEFLASRGYQTAGFVANTFWCSYESRMNRGFVHYEDYPLTPSTALGSTMPGRWLLENLRHLGDAYAAKWIRSQSRDARGINAAFLDWLSRSSAGPRPFFAFLNYLDAHEPFVPPDDSPPLGLRRESRRDSRMLLEYWDTDKSTLSERELRLARDSYDDCIRALDRQVGALLDELDRRGVLRETLVIVTSDHGEHFGEHGVFDHGFSLYAPELRVPLLILDPSISAGREVAAPVSLRDLPATVVDLLGLHGEAPFPGRSLAGSWIRPGDADHPVGSHVYSEVEIPAVVEPQRGDGPKQRGFTVSLVDRGLHYILDVRGTEELFDLGDDPEELRDIEDSPARKSLLFRFRSAILRILGEGHVTSRVAAGRREGLKRLLESMAPRSIL